MLSPASGPAVLRLGNDVVSLYVQTALSLRKSSLDGLASSHVLQLTLSGVPKILLYCTEYRRPTTLVPTKWRIMGSMRKNLTGEKNYFANWWTITKLVLLNYITKMEKVLHPMTSPIKHDPVTSPKKPYHPKTSFWWFVLHPFVTVLFLRHVSNDTFIH